MQSDLKGKSAGSDRLVPVNPRLLLHLEGTALFAFSVFLYHHTQASWWQFLLLFMLPDVSISGYLFIARVGALTY